MILSGSTVRSENVRLLASMLDGDELAAKLERALTNGDTIVAISLADRQRVVTVLGDDAPGGLADLRRVLVKQLAQHHERERGVRQAQHDERERRQRGG